MMPYLNLHQMVATRQDIIFTFLSSTIVNGSHFLETSQTSTLLIVPTISNGEYLFCFTNLWTNLRKSCKVESARTHNLMYRRFTARTESCRRVSFMGNDQIILWLVPSGECTGPPLIEGLKLKDKYNVYQYYSKQNRYTLHYIQEW
jgi:hypothetical protein